MNSIYMALLKRIGRGLLASAIGTGIPALIKYLEISTDPWLMAASPLLTAALLGAGKFLRDKFNLPNVPV